MKEEECFDIDGTPEAKLRERDWNEKETKILQILLENQEE